MTIVPLSEVRRRGTVEDDPQCLWDSRQYAHDHAPPCPDCGTDVFVVRTDGPYESWHCLDCGQWWTGSSDHQ